MTYPSRWYRSLLAGIALIAGLGLFSTSALAQTAGGTASGVDITNQATLNYGIAGTAQPAVTSNLTTFKVDNLVRVVTAEVGATHSAVAPGALAQVTTFTVTNTGNTAQDYTLAAANLVGGSLTFGAVNYTDTFDALSCQAYVESGTTVGYPAVSGSNSKTVYVVCNIPAAGALPLNPDAIVQLTATTQNAGTCSATGASCVLTTQTAGADNPTGVDVVFADAAGPAGTTGDIARDGKSAALDVYRVVAASITVAKTVSSICDPLNLVTNPKSIPGAYVKYSITITNAGTATASATLATITDALNANLNFDPNLVTGLGATCDATPESLAGRGFKLACAGTGNTRTCVATPTFYTTVSGDDAIGISGSTITADLAAALPLVGTCVAGGPTSAAGSYCAGELKPGESASISFNAIIK